ncbi:MAG: CBS domain-containing protein [Actinomycetota bacterium]|nr:CBS domain-containing protein [Actinomycetota bacterium]
MAPKVKDVMTPNPVTVPADAPIIEAAKQMRERDIGNVIVIDGDHMCGVVTDRDIVVRAVAEGSDLQSTPMNAICTKDPLTVSPDDDVTAAGDLMRDNKVRRVPVVDGGSVVGIVSIGDLAVERDPDSPLATISAAEPNN